MKELSIKLKVWRQKNSKDKGRFIDYDVPGLNEHMSFFGDVRCFKRTSYIIGRRTNCF